MKVFFAHVPLNFILTNRNGFRYKRKDIRHVRRLHRQDTHRLCGCNEIMLTRKQGHWYRSP